MGPDRFRASLSILGSTLDIYLAVTVVTTLLSLDGSSIAAMAPSGWHGSQVQSCPISIFSVVTSLAFVSVLRRCLVSWSGAVRVGIRGGVYVAAPGSCPTSKLCEARKPMAAMEPARAVSICLWNDVYCALRQIWCRGLVSCGWEFAEESTPPPREAARPRSFARLGNPWQQYDLRERSVSASETSCIGPSAESGVVGVGDRGGVYAAAGSCPTSRLCGETRKTVSAI
ncbi:hypothetical protein P280DRAFT_479022 [Massarina eburnea CBS 473.64]|uniref:Uncharacterized protein n=1 Tax=Massarina eburnea CBS 473.64 TaxID=1395130 RepID=A0A6A6S3P8_9PLEO|nr:hypothetical protein P280DRAFT_479022 [Massarina eburnea CBS 473.64]